MHLVDTCGWIEWFSNAKLAETYQPLLRDVDLLIVPTLVQFELYRWALREGDESVALLLVGHTETCRVVPLDTRLAIFAAELASQYKLAMADAVVYATALTHADALHTSDTHFKGLPKVHFHPKNASVTPP